MTGQNRLATIGLLSISIALTGMEIKNWDYKERDKGYIGYFLPKQQDPKEYPYFLPEKDNSESQRSFSDELLFAKSMQLKGLPEDVTNQILYNSYLTEKTLDLRTMNRFKKRFGINKLNFLYLPMKSKRALLYIIEREDCCDRIYRGNVVVYGKDKDFALKMSQYILDLPLSIRKKIVDQTGEYMLCNTKYEPSMYNTLLGEDDDSGDANKRRLTKIAKIATAGALTFGGIGVLTTVDLPKDSGVLVFGLTAGAGVCMISSTINQITRPDVLSGEQDARINSTEMGGVASPFGALTMVGSGVYYGGNIKTVTKDAMVYMTGTATGVMVAECAGLYVHDKCEKLFEESLEERDMRLGFEKIYLLKDEEKM